MTDYERLTFYRHEGSGKLTLVEVLEGETLTGAVRPDNPSYELSVWRLFTELTDIEPDPSYFYYREDIDMHSDVEYALSAVAEVLPDVTTTDVWKRFMETDS